MVPTNAAASERLFSNQSGKTMTNPQSNNENWSDCPPETLTTLASVLRRRQRWHRLQRIVTIAAAVLIIVSAGQYVITQSSQQHSGPSYAGISCVEVSQLLPDYVAGKVSDGQRAKIVAHLELCSSCRSLERSLRDRQRSADAGFFNDVKLTSLARSER